MNDNRPSPLILSDTDPFIPLPSGPAQVRLRHAFARMRYIELVREYRQDPEFGKTDEEQMIDRELLDLALQEAGDQMQRFFEAAGEEFGDRY